MKKLSFGVAFSFLMALGVHEAAYAGNQVKREMESVESKFLRYVAVDTQSDPRSETYPSTAKQLRLLNMLLEEMLVMGLEDVEIDEHGYVTGTIPATTDEKCPVVGFLAHVDTSPDMSGKDVKPRMFVYGGGDIVLNEKDGVVMRIADFPELETYTGHTLIVSDGTTLLGADDKAGVAEIMAAAEYLVNNPQVKHGKIRIAFTPDEEVGRGVDYFSVADFGADFAYTVDGGALGELEYENFNAATAKIEVSGMNIHPGYAKGKMINALSVAGEFDAAIPASERPETTEGYEGFYHLTHLCGEVEHADIEYIIRDHDRAGFEVRKEFMKRVATEINARYGREVVVCDIQDQYYNMLGQIEARMEVVDIAKRAMVEAGVEPVVKPIRGGTDGARLSYMGLPCPNIFAGGVNFHGRYEYVSVEVMNKSVETIINIAKLAAESR